MLALSWPWGSIVITLAEVPMTGATSGLVVNQHLPVWESHSWTMFSGRIGGGMFWFISLINSSVGVTTTTGATMLGTSVITTWSCEWPSSTSVGSWWSSTSSAAGGKVFSFGTKTGADGTDDWKEWWQLGPQRFTVSSGE